MNWKNSFLSNLIYNIKSGFSKWMENQVSLTFVKITPYSIVWLINHINLKCNMILDWKIPYDSAYQPIKCIIYSLSSPSKPMRWSVLNHSLNSKTGAKRLLDFDLLLPQRANMEKRKFYQPQNWMRQRVFSALGIQTGPFASL